ncbi:TIGR03619 family F420-dependent LLM class oxidoreductase [Streptomyces sp. NPDC092296]|uniref:TIGR03619 family F420-dependent LLM class oxidoreductase n=1 Tax=Streptomyces sp. NPDC092296 TaxID=3366012 RepID=UPI00380C7D6C
MTIRLGLGLPQMKQYDLGHDVVAVAREAERIGYDSLWVFERVLVPENPRQGMYGIAGLAWQDSYRSVADPLVVLALAAAVTERVRLGSSVLVAGLHLPFSLARTLASLDAASGGRVLAGFGTGWSLDEYEAAGAVPFDERGAALDDLLDVCAAVWGPNPVSYRSRRTAVQEAEVGPKPARPIPVYLAAGGRRALDRLARRADGWLPTGAPPDLLAARWRELTELTASYGRDPDRLGYCVRANARLTREPVAPDRRQPFVGTVEQLVADVAAHAAAGAREVLLDLQGSARDAAELTDLAARLHTEVRAAGV